MFENKKTLCGIVLGLGSPGGDAGFLHAIFKSKFSNFKSRVLCNIKINLDVEDEERR